MNAPRILQWLQKKVAVRQTTCRVWTFVLLWVWWFLLTAEEEMLQPSTAGLQCWRSFYHCSASTFDPVDVIPVDSEAETGMLGLKRKHCTKITSVFRHGCGVFPRPESADSDSLLLAISTNINPVIFVFHLQRFQVCQTNIWIKFSCFNLWSVWGRLRWRNVKVNNIFSFASVTMQKAAKRLRRWKSQRFPSVCWRIWDVSAWDCSGFPPVESNCLLILSQTCSRAQTAAESLSKQSNKNPKAWL